MKFRLLGPLEVWDGERAIPLGGPKQRAVLAHLLLHGNEEVLILRGHDYLVSGITFSPDGTRLVSASPDGIVHIWALDLDDLIEIANEEKTRSLTNEECGQYLHLRRCPNN